MEGKINFVIMQIYQRSVPTNPHNYSLYHSQNLQYFSLIPA